MIRPLYGQQIEKIGMNDFAQLWVRHASRLSIDDQNLFDIDMVQALSMDALPDRVDGPDFNDASLRSFDLAHIAVMHGGHMPVVPGDGDAGPIRISDDASVSGITAPAKAMACLEVFGFSGGQRRALRIFRVHQHGARLR